jgi:hypothetical protein
MGGTAKTHTNKDGGQFWAAAARQFGGHCPSCAACGRMRRGGDPKKRRRSLEELSHLQLGPGIPGWKGPKDGKAPKGWDVCGERRAQL